MLDSVVSNTASPVEEPNCSAESVIVDELREQVSTLEELLQVYEESAVEQERRLKGMLSVLNEKTQQLEHAEEALQTLHSILDSMGDAVVVVNSDGCPLFVNPAARQLIRSRYGNPSLLTGTQTYPSVDKDEISYLLDYSPIVSALEGESVDAAEIRAGVPESCRNQWLSINARPITVGDDTDNKKITGAVAVFRDVTQRKQAEEDLQQSHEIAQKQTIVLKNTLRRLKQTQAQLIHGEKMASLGQTVAGIAHEINNPVSFIHGNLNHTADAFNDLLSLIELFQKTYPDRPDAINQAIDDLDLTFLAADVPRMLTSMKTGTCRIREIVKSLRVFARLDEAEVKAVDINQGIDSAVMLLQSKLSEHPKRPDIKLQRQYGNCLLLNCYASQLNQVFVHLLSNAIDALETDNTAPEIIIRTRADEVALTVEIEDNGQGISPDVQSKMFDPFFTTKPVGRGTGLGLSICYQIIVDTHGGAITCSSEVNPPRHVHDNHFASRSLYLKRPFEKTFLRHQLRHSFSVIAQLPLKGYCKTSKEF